MKFVIEGVEYPAAELLATPANMFPRIKRETGLGFRRIVILIEEWPRLGFDVDGEVVVNPEGQETADALVAVYDSPDHWTAILAWVWLSRRLVDGDVSFTEATSFDLAGFGMAVDDEDEPVEDPTEPAGGSSLPAVGAPVPETA